MLPTIVSRRLLQYQKRRIEMITSRHNIGSIVGGTLLIAFGVLALMTQLFGGFDFWHFFWPLIIVGIGCTFFAAMIAGGKSAAGLAIPGSILSSIGLMFSDCLVTGKAGHTVGQSS
jgi:hypothetical protein